MSCREHKVAVWRVHTKCYEQCVRVLVGKLVRNGSRERPWRRWEGIKIDVREAGWAAVDCTDLTGDTDNVGLLRTPYSAANFWTSWGTSSFWTRTVLCRTTYKRWYVKIGIAECGAQLIRCVTKFSAEDASRSSCRNAVFCFELLAFVQNLIQLQLKPH